jgi:hypothetical protein
VVFIIVLALGASAGWVLHSWGEPERLEKARSEAVEKNRLRDKVKAQGDAIARQTETLRVREHQLEAAEQELQQLKDEKERHRAQSKDPGVAVLPADDPWLRSKRARSDGVGRLDLNH